MIVPENEEELSGVITTSPLANPRRRPRRRSLSASVADDDPEDIDKNVFPSKTGGGEGVAKVNLLLLQAPGHAGEVRPFSNARTSDTMEIKY
jgi:hypothetical protein